MNAELVSQSSELKISTEWCKQYGVWKCGRGNPSRSFEIPGFGDIPCAEIPLSCPVGAPLLPLGTPLSVLHTQAGFSGSSFPSPSQDFTYSASLRGTSRPSGRWPGPPGGAPTSTLALRECPVSAIHLGLTSSFSPSHFIPLVDAPAG